MTISKRISICIASFLLVLAGILFASCGSKNYSNVYISCSVQDGSISLFVDNSTNVTFTVENPVKNMNTNLSENLTNESICDVNLISSQGSSYTYEIVAKKGGRTSLQVSTIEGNKTASLEIYVRSYSSQLNPADHSLYVSEKSSLIPTSYDFVFSSDTTEKNLSYYFFGQTTQPDSLVLEDVKDGDNFINQFISVKLLNKNGSFYLIFEDNNNNYFTLGNSYNVPSIFPNVYNLKYDFISVEFNDGEYVFDLNTATEVKEGDKFSFITVYDTNTDDTIFCEREFFVLIDIDYENISHKFGYKILDEDYQIGSDNYYVIDELGFDSITLIPNYQYVIEDNPLLIGKIVSFITVYLQVTINSTSPLILSDFYSDDLNIISANKLGQVIDENEGNTTYYFEINCSNGTSNKLNFNINFYYEGFENSEDSNVNFVYSIPVNIKIIPTNLLVNNVDLSVIDKTFIFYNSYAGDAYGWQEFNFNSMPQDAEYSHLIIDLTDSNLKLRYRNQIYSSSDGIIEITDLRYPIYLKGENGAEVSTETLILPISLYFNVLREDYINVQLKYKITKGAEILDFKTDDFEQRIYIDINQNDPVEFLDIFADAEFTSFDINLDSGTNVAEFIIDEENPYVLQDNKYFLNMKIIPISIGSGVYAVALDNGRQVTLSITCDESLNSIQVSTNNVNNIVKSTFVEDTSTKFYAYRNAINNYFDVSVLSNNNKNSSAIKSLRFNSISSIISLADATDSNKNFNIYLNQNGNGQINLIISGYDIKNFTRSSKTINYIIEVVSFDYIENLQVYKEKDGKDTYKDPNSSSSTVSQYGISAAYVDVYTNTNSQNARTAILNVAVLNPNAYLFVKPSSLTTTIEYDEAMFSQNYIYWETPFTCYLDGKESNYMYFDPNRTNNVYTIENVGTFDTSSMTFVASTNTEISAANLTCHVRQFGWLYSYTVNIKITKYIDVENVQLQTSITELEFSSLKQEHTIIAYVSNSEATNKKLVAIINGAQINIENEVVSLLPDVNDEKYVKVVESDNKYSFTFTANPDFITLAENYEEKISGEIIIAPENWVDSDNNLLPEYQNRVVRLDISYANGTIGNRFTLESSEDILKIKENLSAHYKIKNTIDISSISSQLPLGDFSGSIIGLSEYSKITGININSSQIIDNNNYYGLFTSITESGFIEYVSFEGIIQVSSNATNDKTINYIGLVAGKNYGTLLNIGVVLNESNIILNSQSYVGGVVGYNEGNIVQDYTLFKDNNLNTSNFDYILNEEIKNCGIENVTIVDEGDKVQNMVFGRISYFSMTPNILIFMNKTLEININTEKDVYIGGAIGYHANGLVKKIDSADLKTVGYTNYLAYSLIDISRTIETKSSVFAGGLAGYMKGENAQIIAGYNKLTEIGTEQIVAFQQYLTYENNEDGSTYIAGKGIVVGGEIRGYDNIAGVIGYSSSINNTNLSGITSRAFVRGLMYTNTNGSEYFIAKVAVISNVSSGSSLSSAFAIQAVDEGRMGSDASMIIIYDNKNEYSYYNENYVTFGKEITTQVMNIDIDGDYINVLTYLTSRTQVNIKDESIIDSSTKSKYYGDFVVLQTNDNKEELRNQIFFHKDENSQFMSVDPNFNNKFTGGSKQVFFMYYFDATDGENSQTAQSLLDTYLNKISVGSSLYPFVVNGEISFTSMNTDILSIDQNGKITVKQTGLALIKGTSLLNNTNAIDIYLYVTNYFNPGFEGSIVYPNGSSSSTPIDQTTIDLRGNNTATLYIIPNYSLKLNVVIDGKDSEFNSSSAGVVSFSNIVFNLSNNYDVTANVTIKQNEDDKTNCLDIEINGQTINFRRNSNTDVDEYELNIITLLKLTFNENGTNIDYTCDVNKKIINTTLNYKKGAQSINNVNYSQAPIISSQEINETIIVNSDAKESELYYYILGLDNEYLQGSETLKGLSGFNLQYALENNDQLFVIEGLDKNLYSSDKEISNFVDQLFNVKIKINKESTYFKNRYNQNIYGQYQIFIIASSNTEQITSFYINFDQTNITSIVVDNYPNINEVGDGAIVSTSDYAYPGSTGLLAITITPEDGDFDYILIENADENYQEGKAVANLSFAARNDLSKDENKNTGYIDDSIIWGSSTNKGIRVTLEEIVSLYNRNKYINYDGVVYVIYELENINVIDESISNINISLVKDGIVIKQTTKPLIVKLQNFVAVEIDGKESITGQEENVYATYNVARGVKYKLNINSYGFLAENIELISENENLGTISYENGSYYLQITNNSINYISGQNGYIFDLIISANQSDGEVERFASSRTRIQIQEYVINYNGETATGYEDIISGMGNGVINIQVGSQTTLAVDVYDYIEYNPDNTEVVNNIESFLYNLAVNGSWIAYTNLINDGQPDYGAADNPDDNKEDTHKRYILGYSNSVMQKGSNYFFNYNGLNITPVVTHVPEDGFYRIYFKASFDVQNGLYVASPNGNKKQTFRTSFVFNVYTASSNESPIPVYDYEDFMDMQQGGYYILLNDITLPNKTNEITGETAFVPKAANFKSLDGNGHSIIFSGAYDVGGLSNIGIFTTLPEDSIIKNLNVIFSSAQDGSDLNIDDNKDRYELYGLRTVKFITTASSFNFGSIVGENNGIITNCKVRTDVINSSEYYIAVIADNSTSGSFIGGIAGTNSGYITNCGVSANIKTPFRVGGIVGSNSGKIAASYFKESKIINNSNQNQYAAGFAYSNLEEGQIITSYVSGAISNDILITKDKTSYVSSNEQGAGFVYQNLGTISDCYTNIYLGVTPIMAGFVYENGGEIKNSFSLSELSNENAAAAGFAYNNVVNTAGESTLSYYGTFENCYFFYNEKDSNLIIGYDYDINTSLQEKDFDGVQKLNAEQFNDIASYFADYSYQNTIGVNAVWFYSDGNTSTTYVEYVPTTNKIEIETEGGKVQTNTIYNTQIKTFSKGRLELVSANIDTLSIRNFSYSQVDEASGNITYYYIDDSSVPNSGSIHNPRIIYDSETMEAEILEQNANNNINITNYRIVSDISYSEKPSSSLYKTIFAGILEGNGMDITSISLLSEENMISAGLFAQVGYSSSKTGSIKNLTISPTEVTFANTNCVGTIAGILKYGYLYDINIVSSASGTGTSVVYGMNFVGGIVGRANNSYIIKNVTTDINTTASYMSSGTSIYTENSNINTIYSYSGAVVGFAGAGTITNAYVVGTTSVMGSRAGFAYGGIGKNSNVNYTFVNVAGGITQSQIKAYHYGGLIAGEIAGNLNYAYVYGNDSILSPFSTVPMAASAVGGIAGSLIGGNISNCVVDQSFRVTNTTDATSGIFYVGGIVGSITQAGSTLSTITNSIVYQNIIAGSVLGGAVGYVYSPVKLDNIAIKSPELSITGQKTNPYLGGVIGQIDSAVKPSVTLLNSYCLSNLKLETITYGVASTANVGGLIGSNSENITLKYCYTTSKIDASVSDSRALGSLQEFNTFTDTNVLYSYNISANVTTENVYYFGHNTDTDGSSINSINPDESTSDNENLNAYRNSFVTYKSKAQNAEMHLVVNNYGNSSLSYSGNFAEDETNALINSGLMQSTFYNLFGSTYSSKNYESVFFNNVSNKFVVSSGRENLIFNFNADNGAYGREIKLTTDDLENGELNSPIISNMSIISYYLLSDNTKVYYLGGKYYSNIKFVLDNNKDSSDDNKNESLTIQGSDLIENGINWEGAKLVQVINKDFSTINNIKTYIDSNGIKWYKINENDENYYSKLYFIPNGFGGFKLDRGDEVSTLKNVSLIPSIDYSVLVQVTILKDSSGNYYESGIDNKGIYYVNIQTGKDYHQNADGKWDIEVPTIPVWITSSTGYSTLSFESDLGWLEKA